MEFCLPNMFWFHTCIPCGMRVLLDCNHSVPLLPTIYQKGFYNSTHLYTKIVMRFQSFHGQHSGCVFEQRISTHEKKNVLIFCVAYCYLRHILLVSRAKKWIDCLNKEDFNIVRRFRNARFLSFVKIEICGIKNFLVAQTNPV